MPENRILLVSSDRTEWFESASNREQFERFPYSHYAILYHLAQKGWKTCRAGWRTSIRLKSLAQRIDAFQPSIIYTYGSTVALNPLICRRYLCKWKAFKIIHGWDDLYGDIWGNLAGWPGRILMNVMERLIITRSDHVVTLSRFLQQRGKGWGVDGHYIPNGADIPVFDRSACSIHLEGDMKLVYTGDQARWKRTADICEAMRHVPNNIKLYLTGRRYRYLDKYASDNCIFLGYVSRNDQLCVMDQADVLVSTADQDCNAKLQEYLRFKKPILGYDGRMNLFFKNGVNALLTRDYPSAIMTLFNSPALRASLAEQAARDIPIYTWREIADQFDAFFASVSPASATHRA
ncbi:MAG TPA: glycosyltransferase [Kiritimatiellia bacterium]|nr:glycosyltransferase [Kiritimatiellia bacterium]